MQLPFRKRDGQFYLQTWHGTPLKRISFDMTNPPFITGTAYFDHLARDVAQWDLLLSPNPFSTPMLRAGVPLRRGDREPGYPRNDLLLRADAPEAGRAGAGPARAARREAGGALTRRPGATTRCTRTAAGTGSTCAWTWSGPGSALGEDHVLLIRGHHHMADDVPAGMRDGFALNVTAYPDIADLYLAADVLVTDYSSAMFDYAVTGRPIVFFAYDLAEYRDEPARLLLRLRSGGARPAPARLGRRDRGHPGRRRRRRRAPRRLSAFHGPVLLPGRRQRRRAASATAYSPPDRLIHDRSVGRNAMELRFHCVRT